MSNSQSTRPDLSYYVRNNRNGLMYPLTIDDPRFTYANTPIAPIAPMCRYCGAYGSIIPNSNAVLCQRTCRPERYCRAYTRDGNPRYLASLTYSDDWGRHMLTLRDGTLSRA